MGIDLSLQPGNYGIIKLLRPGRKVIIGSHLPNGGVRFRLRAPWQPGDTANEARAAHHVRTLLTAEYQRPFDCTLLTWKSPEMLYKHIIKAIEVPAGLSDFPYDSPHLVRYRGAMYFNPTPFQFNPEHIIDVHRDPESKKYSIDLIEIVGLEQPLQFPADGNGLFYFMEVNWCRLEQFGPLAPPALRVIVGASLMRDYQKTAGEITCQVDFCAVDLFGLAGLFRRFSDDVLTEELTLKVRGPLGRDQQFDFLARARGIFIQIVLTFARGFEISQLD